MNDLIEALVIFRKYMLLDSYGWDFPFHCEHDVLTFCGVEPALVSEEDKVRLDELSFFVDDYEDCFKSYRFGRADGNQD